MSEIISDVAAFFVNLPIGAKIAWCILGIIFIVSIIRSILAQEAGGIGAGVISGIAACVFLSDKKWLHDLKYIEPYILIPVGIIVVLGIIFMAGVILMLSERLISKKRVRFLGILLRVMGVAIITAFSILLITSIGNAGMIFY